MSVGNLLEALPPDIDVTMIGTTPKIVDWAASRRPGTQQLVVEPIRNRYALRSMLRFRRAIARLRPDVIQFNLPWAYNARWEILAASTVRRTSVVVVEQSPFPLPTRSARILKRLSEHRIDVHTAVSEAVAREVRSVVGDKTAVRVIRHGVPDLPPRTRASHAPAVLGTIARLDPMKGIDVLVRSLPSIPGARLVVVGSGTEDASLRDLATSLGVGGRVEWAGWSEHPRSRLGDFDVFVLPSRMEGLGIVLCEAMLAGLPVVASRVGGIPEVVVDGTTGLLVPPDDPIALSDAIARLLGDAELRARMGAAGRRRAEELFTASVMARAYELLYEELVPTWRATSAMIPRTTSEE